MIFIFGMLVGFFCGMALVVGVNGRLFRRTGICSCADPEA